MYDVLKNQGKLLQERQKIKTKGLFDNLHNGKGSLCSGDINNENLYEQPNLENMNIVNNSYNGYINCGQEQLKNEIVNDNALYGTPSRMEMNQNFQQTNNLVCSVGNTLVNKVDRVEKTINRELSKKKRSIVNYRLLVREKDLAVERIFDNDYSDYKVLIPKLAEGLGVYNIKFEGISDLNKKYYEIWINNRGIIGNINKISGKDIYNDLLAANVEIYDVIPVSKIYELLNKFFRSALLQNENEEIIAGRAGWLGDTYYHSLNARRFANIIKYDFPIYSKVLTQGKIDKFIIRTYFNILNGIDNNIDRLLLCLYPYMGILATIFNEHDIQLPKTLNLVFIDTTYKRNILRMLKIFNRNSQGVVGFDMSDKNLEKLLIETKDEVLVMDACIGNAATKYKKDKAKNTVLKIASIASKEIEIKGGKEETNLAVAFATDQYIINELIYNIVVDEFFMKENTEESNLDVFGIIFSDFIEYAMRYLLEIKDIISKKRNCGNKSKVLNITLEILNEYFNLKGFCFEDEIGANKGDLYNLFDIEGKSNDEELLDMFIKAFRKSMPNFCVQHKEIALEMLDECIYFDENFMWVSKYALDYVLVISGLVQNRNRILQLLSEQRYLITDGKGYTKKLQINKDRRPFYQIDLSLFNKNYDELVSIIALGDEIKND